MRQALFVNALPHYFHPHLNSIMFSAYKRYPFPVSLRTKFFNIFRYFFSYPFLEKFLVAKLSKRKTKWSKFIPPLYFYNDSSIRQVKRNNINYRLCINRLMDHSIYFFSVRDEGWVNLFRILKPEFSVIDAGANIGFLSLKFAQLCSRGLIYSFEPDSETFSFLRQNVELNKVPNVKLFNKALGAESGVAKLYKLYANNPGANRILKERPESPVVSETIELLTLDALKREGFIRKVDLIKIDVEGYELFVLKGAKEVIEEWKPLLFIELAEINLRQQHCTALDLIEFVENLGYNVLDARNMQPVDKTFANHHTDILCFPNRISTI